MDYEPPVYGVSSISACQTWAKALEQFGANYFIFDGITEECQLYSALQVAQLTITNVVEIEYSKPMTSLWSFFLYFLLLCFIQANCKVIGGPKTAPPLAECPSSSWTPALHFFGRLTVSNSQINSFHQNPKIGKCKMEFTNINLRGYKTKKTRRGRLSQTKRVSKFSFL